MFRDQFHAVSVVNSLEHELHSGNIHGFLPWSIWIPFFLILQATARFWLSREASGSDAVSAGLGESAFNASATVGAGGVDGSGSANGKGASGTNSTGDATGDASGDATGDTTGETTGDAAGDVFGDVTAGAGASAASVSAVSASAFVFFHGNCRLAPFAAAGASLAGVGSAAESSPAGALRAPQERPGLLGPRCGEADWGRRAVFGTCKRSVENWRAAAEVRCWKLKRKHQGIPEPSYQDIPTTSNYIREALTSTAPHRDNWPPIWPLEWFQAPRWPWPRHIFKV